MPRETLEALCRDLQMGGPLDEHDRQIE
jgi:hypothetical protein